MSGRTTPLLLAAALVASACSSSTSGVSQTSSRTSVGAVADVADEPAAEPGDDAPADGRSAADGPSGDDSGDVEPAPFEPAPIEWEDFNDAVDVGTLEVPVDYDDPDGPRFELFLARYNALEPDDRIGTLLVNPGGPGWGGTVLAFLAAQQFDRELLDRFDIVGWDPRGTGESDPPIDCIDDWDPYVTAVDSTPETDAERQAIIEAEQDFARQCIGRNRDIIQHVGTNNSARDMDAIRRAIGEDTISYFGFSYGSELGATWATLFPDTVRAAVLDGASDPAADSDGITFQQQRGFAASLDTFLSRCADDEECEFHNDGDPATAFERLLEGLDAEPISAAPGRPDVNRDVAISGVLEALYDDAYWPALERSLAAAQDGDGSGLLALHDAYYLRAPDGTYGNELEAHRAISCADESERPSIEEVEAEAAVLAEAAPRLNPEGTLEFFCTFFPESLEPRATITGGGAGPIVVIGTTGDPATPFDSTVRMAETLEDGRLVVVEADQHTGYGVNRCVIEIVNDYLIDLDAPDDGTECR